MGVTPEATQAVFDKSISSVPCVYLFTLGTAKDLREEMGIPEEYKDNAIVCKYGMTSDIKRRTGELEKKYKGIKSASLKLKLYSFIDPKYISEAEKEVSETMSDTSSKLKYRNEREIFIVEDHNWRYVNNTYEGIERKYRGRNTDLIDEINNLKIELRFADERIKNIEATTRMQLELKDKDLELKEKDLKILKMENELLKMKLEKQN